MEIKHDSSVIILSKQLNLITQEATT